ncbi:MAG TPA: heme exporter protein CcmD [Aestuariivirgaceae bacterium]|jgi:heme exporter protein CcmD|nr:heme exporter protein CcmD [Aestuariivirgaceae bacterium]
MDLGASHIGFVIAAYAISAAVLTGLVAKTILSLKARQRELSALDKREAPRRKSRR